MRTHQCILVDIQGRLVHKHLRVSLVCFLMNLAHYAKSFLVVMEIKPVLRHPALDKRKYAVGDERKALLQQLLVYSF